MSVLAYYRLPKSTLATSMPLRAMVQLGGPNDHDVTPEIVLLLERLVGSEEGRDEAWLFRPTLPGRFVLDVPPRAISEGAYSMAIHDGEGVHDVDEVLWVMDDAEYLARAREIAIEPFEPAQGLDAQSTVAFSERLIDHELRPDRFDQDGGWTVSTHTPDGMPERTFPDAAVRWATVNAVDAFRYLALGGVHWLHWHLILTKTHFGVKIHTELLPTLDLARQALAWEAVLQDLRTLEPNYSAKNFDIALSPLDVSHLELGVRFALDGIPLAG